MTLYVWIEWICTRCQELHRMKFEIVAGLRTSKYVKGITISEDDYAIEDYPYDSSDRKHSGKKSRMRHGSRIFVKWDTDISEICSWLESYMLRYYAVKEGSLSMDVCRE